MLYYSPLDWQDKAHRIIASLCREAYIAANNGKKRHVPYDVPDTAKRLVECLSRNDELEAKRIFMYDYDACRVS